MLVLAALLGGCGPPQSGAPDLSEADEARPRRIVSLDYCADQYVLRFADRERILAVSPDAGRDFSYMRDQAAGLPSVRPVVEDVLVLRPDLVVRSYGGGPRAAAMFARAGVAVHTLHRAENFPSILRTITAAADALGAPEEGREVAAETRRRLDALRQAETPLRDRVQATRGSVLYMTPAGVTTGPGSLIHELLTAAGLDNFESRPGWLPLPLERLAYEQPDLIAVAFFGSQTDQPSAWSPGRHPLIRAQLAERPSVTLEGAWTACGAWFLLDAVEALARAAATIAPDGAQ